MGIESTFFMFDRERIDPNVNKSMIGTAAIGEILRSKAFYEEKMKKIFRLCIAANNALSVEGNREAELNNIIMYGRAGLSEMLRQHKITISDIDREELRRLQKID